MRNISVMWIGGGMGGRNMEARSPVSTPLKIIEDIELVADTTKSVLHHCIGRIAFNFKRSHARFIHYLTRFSPKRMSSVGVEPLPTDGITHTVFSCVHACAQWRSWTHTQNTCECLDMAFGGSAIRDPALIGETRSPKGRKQWS